MITRLREFFYWNWWQFALWVYGPWRICYNCKECEPELYEDDVEYCCMFRDRVVDPNDKGCRAFRGWRKDR